MTRLVSLRAGGDVGPWQQLGLSFQGATSRLGDVAFVVLGGAPGLVDWTIASDRDDTVSVDGITTQALKLKSTSIISEAVAKAAPDGYTITQLPLGIYRIPHMQKTNFDPIKDLTHIACLTGYTFCIASTLDAPFKTLKEMVAYAKANPGKLEYGHTGTGTTPHLAIEDFSQKAGIELNPIPFKGAAEILQAIFGGHIRMASSTSEIIPLVKEGKLRLLSTLGSKRTKAFPDVPTVKESGWDTISESPFGIGGPKGMDPAIVRILQDAFKKTLDDPKVIATLDQYYQPTIYMNSEDYSKYAVRTFESERQTVERLGLAKKT